MIASVAASKPDLRARIRAARSQAVGTSASADEARWPAGNRAGCRPARPPGAAGPPAPLAIAAYIAAPGEPDVAAIRAAVRAAGGVVLLPIPRADRTLDWALDDGRYRPEGRYPIEVPAGRVVGSGAAGLLAHGVRLVLVPALAVDRSGGRLGQGGGYYDRLLSRARGRWRSRPRRPATARRVRSSAADVLVVAVVRDEELLAEGAVPIEAHDQRLPAVLTPTTFCVER